MSLIVITTGQKRVISPHYWRKDGDHEWPMLDGSIIKVHQDAMRSSYDKASEALVSSVGGLSTKIHAKVDSLGQLINILMKEAIIAMLDERAHALSLESQEVKIHCVFRLKDRTQGYRY